MKLRMKSGALRLRVLRSELARLGEGERISEAVQFPGSQTLTFSLSKSDSSANVQAKFANGAIDVYIPAKSFATWSADAEVGIYTSLDGDGGTLEIAIEKDFACLDGTDAENVDTFENPLGPKVC